MKKILIITYYFPPSGGSGVQRWMYFSKYLKSFGYEPVIITVDEKKASYKFLDPGFLQHVEGLQVFRTNTLEPLKMYSSLAGGDARSQIPQGFAGESRPGFFRKLSRFVRGNFFLPDARAGWNRYAFKKAVEVIRKENIELVITNGTPHSTHLVGLKLKRKLGVKWICDFRDPWVEAYYNKQLYRTALAEALDKRMETNVLLQADRVTTVGPGMQQLLMNKLPEDQRQKVRFVYNGYDAESFAGLVKNPHRKFTMLHLGILGENQPVTAFISALKAIVLKNPEIAASMHWQLVGKVSPGIVTEIQNTLPGISLERMDYVPHQAALQYMMDADLLLNSLADTSESALLISGKLMEYLATGNPILALGNPDGDAAALLKDIPQTRIFDRRDVQGIEDFLWKMYSEWKQGIKYEKKNIDRFSRYETTRGYAAIIGELI